MAGKRNLGGASRRSVLGLLGVGGGLGLGAPCVRAANRSAEPRLAPAGLQGAKGVKLVLLGTGGGPVLGQRRHMTSHLLVSDGAAYVVDCGMTVANRIAESGVGFQTIRGVFLTHHHPDHNAEYGPLLLMAWMQGLKGGLDTYGPPPLADITANYLRSIKWTVDLWREDMGAPPFIEVRPHEVAAPGVVMQDDRVKVTAALVQHPPIVPALAYRFDFPDRSIVFSGDTTPTESLVQLARGADVLVHEAMYGPALRAASRRAFHGRDMPPEMFARFMDHMHRDHTRVEDVGRIAQEAGVGVLVLSHLTPGDDAGPRAAIWRAEAARSFRGRIIVGRDLMVI